MSQKTVKIRIPILVDHKGNWHSPNLAGPENDEVAVEMLTRAVASNYEITALSNVVWIEAEVPLPTKRVMRGLVKTQ